MNHQNALVAGEKAPAPVAAVTGVPAVGFVSLAHAGLSGVTDLVLDVRARLRANDLQPVDVLVKLRMDQELVTSTFGYHNASNETRRAAAVIVPSLDHLDGWADELTRRQVTVITTDNGASVPLPIPDRIARLRCGNSPRSRWIGW